MRETVWGVAEGTRLRWGEWDGEFVLFHENSANTHQLNLVAATAIKLLVSEPVNRETLARKTASKLALGFDAALQNDIDELLSQLKSLGIIQAVQS